MTAMRGLLLAMHKELGAPFTGAAPLPGIAGMDFFQLGDDLVLCVCGIGKVNAAMGAQILIDRFAVDELWNAGVTGCFRDDPAGTLLCARACVQHDMDMFGDAPGTIPPMNVVELPCADPDAHAEALALAGYPCRTGVVASGDWFQRDFDRAARIRDHFSADVCDMEAAAAAQVCLRNGVPFHCLKVVSDHLFHPSQYEEYQANVPMAVERLSKALAQLLL